MERECGWRRGSVSGEGVWVEKRIIKWRGSVGIGYRLLAW